ncbi:MAG: VanZ family protein [Lachnospiraceae bacterium]|nr:VanZ family protein [Lachnospiraceae bacterium]
MKYILLFIKTLLRVLLKPLSFLPAIIVMYCILNFSGQSGIDSAQLSYKVTQKLVILASDVTDKNLTQEEVRIYTEKYHYYVRKLAHFSEYMILAITVAFPLYVYGMRGIWLMLFAGAFCVGFACLDEYRQSFSIGRSPSKKDVMIDSCGVFVGIIITRIVGFIGRKTIFAPLAKRR